MSNQIPRWLKLLLQAVVSTCLIAFVIRQIDLTQVKSLLAGSLDSTWRWASLAAALLLFNLSKVVSALRLNIYQRHAGIRLTEIENLRLYYAGMFLNFFLPGGIGGDGYKILVLHRRQAAPVRTLLTTTLADRISGLLILLMLLCMMLPLLPSLSSTLPESLSMAAGTMQSLAIAGYLVLALLFMFCHYRLLKMRGMRLVTVFGCGLAVQLLQLACMALLLYCLQVAKGDYLAYLVIFLLSSVAAVVPLSFGGLGAREITFYYGLSLLHLDPAAGVVASSGFFLLTLLSSLIGALFLPGFSIRRPVPQAS